MEQFSPYVDDSLCVGQRRRQDKNERVILFLKMRPGQQLTKTLENDIQTAIRTALSPRHVPSYIFQVEDIPVSFSHRFLPLVFKPVFHSTLSTGKRLRLQ
jgi:acetoacetyl-CoA synthetase